MEPRSGRVPAAIPVGRRRRLLPQFGLLGRVYVHWIVTIVAVGLLAAAVTVTLFEGPKEHMEGLAAMVVEQVYRDGPSTGKELTTALDSMHQVITTRIVFFDINDNVVASTPDAHFKPLDGREREHLSERGSLVMGHPPLVAVWVKGRGGPADYAIVWLPPPTPPFWKVFVILGVVLLGVGISSLLFSRSLAKPISRLSQAVAEFGAGNLGARAALRRSDELGALGTTFDDMAERIRALMQAQRELLANISHELRTPVARIRVALDIAQYQEEQEPQGPSAPSGVRPSLSEIGQDLQELEELLEGVICTARLDLVDIQPQPLPVRRFPVETGDVLRRAIERFQSYCPNRKVALELLGTQPTFAADSALLRRVFDNLLNNASKYSAEASAIIISASVQGACWVVKVTDHGIGIAPDDLQRIFEPFFRADPSRSRTTGGTGLGLTLAKRIVEAHGGEVSVESQISSGTTVTVSIPIGLG